MERVVVVIVVKNINVVVLVEFAKCSSKWNVV